MPYGPGGYGGGMLPASYNQTPFFSPQAYSQYQPYQGLPGGGLTQIAVQTILGMITNAAGGVPMGTGGGLMNNIRAQNFTFAHDQIASWAYAQDMQTGFGASAAALAAKALNLDTESEQFKARYGSAAGFFKPLAVGLMNNDAGIEAIDMISGGRNRWAMAHHLHMAGKNWRDPITGRTGYGFEATTALTDALYGKQGFDMDSPHWRRNTRGLTSSQIGGAVRDLSLRGIIGEDDITAQDGKIDATKVTQKINAYTKDIVAMNEIFGASGVHGAPIKKLREAIETFTMGANYHLDPGRTEMLIRNTYQAAQNAGVGMEGMLTVLQQGGGFARQLGLTSPGYWSNMAAQDAFSYAAGLSRAGFMAMPSWGSMTPDQLIAARNQINVANAASESGNIIGVLGRLAGEGRLSGDSARLFERLKSGGWSDDLLDANKMQAMIMRDAGLTAGQYQDLRQQRMYNEKALADNDMSEAMRRGAYREAVQTSSRYASGSLGSSIRAAGVRGGAQVAGLSERMRSIANTTLYNLSQSETGVMTVRDQGALATAYARSWIDEMRASGDPEARAMLQHWARVGGEMRDESGNLLTGEAAILAAARSDAARFAGREDQVMLETYGMTRADIASMSYEDFARMEKMKTGVNAELNRFMAGKAPDNNMFRRLFQAAQGAEYQKGAGMLDVAKHLLTRFANISDLSESDPNVQALATRMKAYGDRSAKLEKEFGAGRDKILDDYAKGRISKEEKDEALKALVGNYEAEQDALGKMENDIKKFFKETVFEGKEEEYNKFEKRLDNAIKGAPDEGVFSGSLSMTIGELILNTMKMGPAEAEGAAEGPGGGDSIPGRTGN